MQGGEDIKVANDELKEKEEKLCNQITVDWLFIISSERNFWGIRWKWKTDSCRYVTSHHSFLCSHLGDSLACFRNRRNKSWKNLFLTFLLNEKWWKTWQWTLHVLNIMFRRKFVQHYLTDVKSIRCHNADCFKASSHLARSPTSVFFFHFQQRWNFYLIMSFSKLDAEDSESILSGKSLIKAELGILFACHWSVC